MSFVVSASAEDLFPSIILNSVFPFYLLEKFLYISYISKSDIRFNFKKIGDCKVKKKITPPLTDEMVKDLRAGDEILITGTIYTGRDAAHKRLVDLIDKGENLPIDIEGQIIYYVGPAPSKPGQVINSAGPTTSYRMDPYAPKLIKKGLKGMIGKGARGDNVVDAMKKNSAVYFAATGGAAALISEAIKKVEIVAYDDLGTEAIRKLEVENLPVTVAQDCHGNNLFKQGMEKFKED